MFVHGNPLTAFGSLLGYYRARDERATIVSTERMGKTKSPLTVDELLEALRDPRFNVRFEAIISIARMGPEPRLVKALTDILEGTELSLSVIAAWALGRMGDRDALPTLRHGLDSPYRSIQAHCVRSLGTLGDQESAPLLLERLRSETDKGLRIAYSSALGNLHVRDASGLVIGVLEEIENEGARMELALALARILSGDHQFIRLLRGLRQDRGTTASQVVVAWKRKFGKSFDAELQKLIDDAANQFASGRIDEGAVSLSQVIRQLPHPPDDPVAAQILSECASKLAKSGAARIEYLVLALYVLQMSGVA
jgi:HEAT repeat protein